MSPNPAGLRIIRNVQHTGSVVSIKQSSGSSESACAKSSLVGDPLTNLISQKWNIGEDDGGNTTRYTISPDGDDSLYVTSNSTSDPAAGDALILTKSKTYWYIIYSNKQWKFSALDGGVSWSLGNGSKDTAVELQDDANKNNQLWTFDDAQ